MTNLAINSNTSNIDNRRTLTEHPSVAYKGEPTVVTMRSSKKQDTPHANGSTSS